MNDEPRNLSLPEEVTGLLEGLAATQNLHAIEKQDKTMFVNGPTYTSIAYFDLGHYIIRHTNRGAPKQIFDNSADFLKAMAEIAPHDEWYESDD